MTNEDAIHILLNSNEYHHAKGDLPHSAASIEAFNKAVEALKAERPQGEWIEYDTACHHYKCNQCNADYNRFMVKPNFCPNCGAEMRGDTE